MRFVPAALPLSLLSSVPTAFAAPRDSLRSNEATPAVLRRASPDSPSGNYAPSIVACPSDSPTVRDATALSAAETQWLQKRRPNTIQPMIALMQQANITGFDAPGFIQSHASNLSAIPNIGIAISGGGYRSLFSGGGFLAAADARVPGSIDIGRIGNLLQSTTYMSSNSGGGWLVGSIFANNFSSITALRDGAPGSSLWKFSNDIFIGPADIGTNPYWQQIEAQVNLKIAAGYEVSFSDYWGRALSYQFINAPEGGPAFTFSSIADDVSFAAGDTPLPILMFDEEPADSVRPTIASTVYEINPFEFGSWDDTVAGFVPTKFVGSNFSQGSISNGGNCVEGFDQFGFVIGTTSSLFNESPLTFTPGELPDNVSSLLLGAANAPDGAVAHWVNPFFKWNPSNNENTHTQLLKLVDGGENLENVPLQPMIQPLRQLDVVFAVGNGGDTPFFYPNGSDLRATLQRSQTPISSKNNPNSQGHDAPLFPAVPDADTFINLGLNQRPTFFGCNTTEFAGAAHIPPLIIFMPLAPYNIFANVSTGNLTYTDTQRNALLENGFNVATMGNGTIEEQWPTCLACAVLSRSLERTGTPVPEACQSCFDLHCWNGTTDTTPAVYNPSLILPQTA